MLQNGEPGLLAGAGHRSRNRATEKRGVTFEEYDVPSMKTVNSIATAGGAKAAWFKDSEGNIMAVVQNI